MFQFRWALKHKRVREQTIRVGGIRKQVKDIPYRAGPNRRDAKYWPKNCLGPRSCPISVSAEGDGCFLCKTLHARRNKLKGFVCVSRAFAMSGQIWITARKPSVHWVHGMGYKWRKEVERLRSITREMKICMLWFSIIAWRYLDFLEWQMTAHLPEAPRWIQLWPRSQSTKL